MPRWRRAPRPRARIARAALLVCAAASSGCFSTLYGWPFPPSGFEAAERAGRGRCPEIAGAYANESFSTAKASLNQSPDASRPGSRPRHLAAFFAGVEDPELVERVIFSRPSPSELRVELVGPAGAARDLRFRQGADFSCDGEGYVFDRSPGVRRRAGASIRFGPGAIVGPDASRCLLERTLERDGIGFFLVVPVLEDVSGQWSLFCASPPEPAR